MSVLGMLVHSVPESRVVGVDVGRLDLDETLHVFRRWSKSLT